MMMISGFLPILFSTLIWGKAVPRASQVHEKRESIPAGFSLDGPAALDSMLMLRIALVQSDVDGLVDALHEVSDPSSAKYGQHLTKDQVEVYVKPKWESTKAVDSWLSESGLNATTLSPAGDWIAVEIPVSKANNLFDADYSVFTHESTGTQTIRTLAYSIPTDMQGHVDFVHPTITFPSFAKNSPVIEAWPKRFRTHDDSYSPCGTGAAWMTPACLQYTYGIPSIPAASSSSQIAVTAYDREYAQEADLKAFLAEYRTDMNSSTTFTFQSVNGGLDPQNSSQAGIEANLDTEYVVGLATGIPVTFISTGGDFLEALLDAANYLLGESSPPQVVSTSYGYNENLVSQKLANNLCNAYAQLGARGVSILFASGDGGVSGNKDSGCYTFVPTFPSGCPYVTSVGATTNLPTEQAADFSGGGFSNYWGRPDYQSSSVSSYLNLLGSNNSGLYNTSGRAYPDVSAYGTHFNVYSGGESLLVSGTSCSTPTFASIIALLNDELLTAGKSVLGFLNPFLYGGGAASFNDIVSGNNLACDNYTTGFYATTGWDPVTGLGTPNYTSLRTAAGL